MGVIMHPEFLVMLARAINAKTYLELGVYCGRTFSLMEDVVEKSVGVDINPNFTPKKGILFSSTTEDFFTVNRETFDLIFIDADHQFDSARNDLVSSLKVLNQFGVIAMHDTDPVRQELVDREFCGDSYRVLDWIIEAREDLNVVTLPIWEEGLSLIQRKGDRRANSFLL
jgi:predicted O-methyltransferase YrrM